MWGRLLALERHLPFWVPRDLQLDSPTTTHRHSPTGKVGAHPLVAVRWWVVVCARLPAYGPYAAAARCSPSPPTSAIAVGCAERSSSPPSCPSCVASAAPDVPNPPGAHDAGSAQATRRRAPLQHVLRGGTAAACRAARCSRAAHLHALCRLRRTEPNATSSSAAARLTNVELSHAHRSRIGHVHRGGAAAGLERITSCARSAQLAFCSAYAGMRLRALARGNARGYFRVLMVNVGASDTHSALPRPQRAYTVIVGT